MGAYDNRGKLIASKVEENIKNNIRDANVTATTKEGIEEKFFPVKVEYNNGHKYQVDKNGQIMMSVNAGDTAPSDSNAIYSSGDYTAVIPAGFTVSGIEGETSIENGLVVTDESENEWVWIPVDSTDLSAMYTEDFTGWIMNATGGETGNEAVITKYRTTGMESRVNPGDISGFREPDTVVGTGNQYDIITANWIAAGFTSYKNMVENLRDDYKNMINSVKQYGGFYVGRYELGESVESPLVQSKKM